MSREQIIQKLADELGSYKEERNEVVFRTCPYCKNDRWNFGVNLDKGMFHDWACDIGGSVVRLFRDLNLNFDFDIRFSKSAPVDEEPGVLPTPEGLMEIKDSKNKEIILKYLSTRRITEADVDRYNIKWWEPKKRILFPFYDLAGKLIFWNARGIFKGVKPKYLHAAVPKSNKILKYDGDTSRVWIVEGVFDGITVNKDTGNMVIMLMGSSLSDGMMAYLRTMKYSVKLCLDSDMAKKQVKFETQLKEILGEDKVSSLFIGDGDVASCGVIGDVGLLGYVKGRMRR